MVNKTDSAIYRDKVKLKISLYRMFNTLFVNDSSYYNIPELIQTTLSKCSEEQLLELIGNHFTVMKCLSEEQKTERVIQLHKMLWEI